MENTTLIGLYFTLTLRYIRKTAAPFCLGLERRLERAYKDSYSRYTAAVWAVTVFMWAVTAGMWAVTGTEWAIQA